MSAAASMQVAVTFFPNFAAATKQEATLYLGDLAERIKATTAPRKDDLPWLKLATFGTSRTDKGSLRHDANVLSATGIEGDYDGEAMPFEDAEEALHHAGIASILYTSPSHRPGKPRWRVLCPLDEPVPRQRRASMLGRLNGLLRGILARESFTVSQAYFFGSVAGNPAHRVSVIEGDTIDRHDDLDEVWLGPASLPRADLDVQGEARADAELIARVLAGYGFHVEMTALAGRYIARGMSPQATADTLRGLMLSHPEAARDGRWQDRLDNIPLLIASAEAKYRDRSLGRRVLARSIFDWHRQGRAPDDMRRAAIAHAEQLGLSPDDAQKIAAWVFRVSCGGARHAA